MAPAKSDRLLFHLKTISHIIGAPDLETGLKGIPQLAVPGIADGCAVDILRSKGSMDRLAYLGPLPRIRKEHIKNVILKDTVTLSSTLMQRSNHPGSHVIVPLCYDNTPLAAMSFYLWLPMSYAIYCMHLSYRLI